MTRGPGSPESAHPSVPGSSLPRTHRKPFPSHLQTAAPPDTGSGSLSLKTDARLAKVEVRSPTIITHVTPFLQSQCVLPGSKHNLLRYLRTTGRPWASSWVSVSQKQLPAKFGNPWVCDCAERPQTKTQQRPTLGWVGQPNRCSGVSAGLGERVTWRLLKQHF